MSQLDLVALVVREYEPAIDFFVNVLEFDLIEDSPSLTNDGRAKRWVVVRPRGGATGLLLARADGKDQEADRQTVHGPRGVVLARGRFRRNVQAHARRGREVRGTTAQRGLRQGGRVPRHRRQQVGSSW